MIWGYFQGEESDASGQSELLRKSKVRRKKSSPKKNEEKEDQAHSDSDVSNILLRYTLQDLYFYRQQMKNQKL